MTVEIGAGGSDDGENKPTTGDEVLHDDKMLWELVTELDEQRVYLVQMLEKMIMTDGADQDKVDMVFSHQLRNKTLPMLKKIVSQLGEGHDVASPEFVDVVGTFWLQFENHNIELLKKITPDTDFRELKLENTKKMIHQFGTTDELDTREDRIGGIAFTMAENFTIDMNKASESLFAIRMMEQGGDMATAEEKSRMGNESREAGRNQQGFGGHVLDALKIGFGVASGIVAGLAADRYLRRKK